MAQVPQHKNGSDQVQKLEYDKTFTYRLRRITGGNFSGLWELARLNRMGHVEKLLSDADALNFCMENLQGDLEEEGF